jgi:hypothetical protein
VARIGRVCSGGLLALFLCQITLAVEIPEPSFDKWLEMLDEIDGINDGQLMFLPAIPAADKQILYHLQNRIKLSPNSLETGWVELEQCHQNLGVTQKMAITFGKGKTQDLEIVSFTDIDKAWVDADNIEIIGAGAASSICIRGKLLTLEQTTANRFQLQNGRYLRRFLDGYFPMRLSLSIDYSSTKLSFDKTTPMPQAGFAVSNHGGFVSIESTFEGTLKIVTYFQ